MTALATRIRPSTWEGVQGHEKTVSAIRDFLSRDADKIPHAFGLFGPGGFGKDTIAGLIASDLVPDSEDRALCVKNVDAARYSTSEDMRKLLDEVRQRPMVNAPLVVILSEFQRVKDAARDVLLTALENAGDKEKGLGHLFWVLTSSEPSSSFPDTTIRRLKAFDLKPVPDARLKVLLAKTCQSEAYTVPKELRDRIIVAAQGSPGMALSILETIAPNCTEAMSPEDIEAVAAGIKGPNAASDNLAKALLDGASRADVRRILQGIKAEGKEAESVRRGVLGYCEAAYLGQWYKGNRDPLEIMEVFCAGNTFDSGWSGLIVLAVNAAGSN